MLGSYREFLKNFSKGGARTPTQNRKRVFGVLMSKNLANAVAILSSGSKSIVYEKIDLEFFFA